ncbi:hypothetical protein [Flavobacterium sp. LAR06]|uniref:hypothetical protein n=1 Tax=Flavobacterium sp. LAR06 TaxID=3064897 RepID=UPI0035BFB761
MKKLIFLLAFISFTTYAQTNRFTGTWSNENCKGCSKKYIFKMTIAQSNYKIVGTAEVTSDNAELNSGVMDITGNVYVLGDKAQIKIKASNGQATNAVLYVNENVMQFNKGGGSDLVPDETIMTKLYE